MARLAINGGEPLIKRSLGKSWPIFDEKEERMLLEVLRSGNWWRGGTELSKSRVSQFENKFASYSGAKYGIAITNGTQALECALKAAGVGAGDEVIVPALTFVATATCAALVNAIPIIVDVDPETYNISPAAIEEAITERTRVTIIVHNGGYPCDMDAISNIAKKHNLLVIEDSAHAHGSEWKGKRCGSLGDIGTFSFQQFKVMTSGEGGIVLTSDSELAEKAYSFMHIGRMPGRPFSEFHQLASNLRMTEFQAAILLCQLERLNEQIEIRERNIKYLAQGLKDIEGIEPFKRDKRVTRWSFYYWNFKYKEEEFEGIPRDRFIEALEAEGVPVAVGAHGEPIYYNPLFQNMNFGKTGCPIKCPLYGKEIDYRKTFCPEAERIYKKEALALSHTLFLGSKEDMNLILEAIRKVRDNTDELKG